MPYQLDVALHGAAGAARRDTSMVRGINTVAGQVTNKSVAEALALPFVEPFALLESGTT